MNTAKQKLDTLFGSFNSSSLRQRMIVTAAILIAVHAAWDTLIYQPQVNRLEAAQASLEQERRSLADHSGQKVKIDAVQISKNVEEVATIKQQIAEIDKQIKQAASELIAPDQMPEVLQELLTKNSKLTVTALSTSPAEMIDIGTADKNFHSSIKPVYKHTLKLGFEGDYLSTLAYIRAVEKMGWRIFWDSIKIDSSDYPHSRVSISLYTLSLNKGWIGV